MALRKPVYCMQYLYPTILYGVPVSHNTQISVMTAVRDWNQVNDFSWVTEYSSVLLDVIGHVFSINSVPSHSIVFQHFSTHSVMQRSPKCHDQALISYSMPHWYLRAWSLYKSQSTCVYSIGLTAKYGNWGRDSDRIAATCGRQSTYVVETVH